ncbi:fasciclin domain-containing protein [Phormidium sp. FACHB-1136]|nr:fasciclin domain-containing protein [Phormidium sp. FACHB-1136]
MVDESTGAVLINNAQVITADIMASDGVIHAVDQAFLPPDLAQ